MESICYVTIDKSTFMNHHSQIRSEWWRARHLDVTCAHIFCISCNGHLRGLRANMCFSRTAGVPGTCNADGDLSFYLFHSIISSSPDWDFRFLTPLEHLAAVSYPRRALSDCRDFLPLGQHGNNGSNLKCQMNVGFIWEYRNILGGSWRIYTSLVFIRIGVRYGVFRGFYPHWLWILFGASLKAFWSLGSGCQSWSLWPVLATAQWIPCRAKQVKPLACIIQIL